MRIIFASDTHERHEGVPIPVGDVFVHAGDFTMSGDLEAVSDFGEWVRALPHKHKIVVAGNHDLAFEQSPDLARGALGYGSGMIYLQDSGVEIDGISFWGSPWQPWFFDWAFNLPRGKVIARKWDLIPEATDVLITHGPPTGVLDSARGEHVGCADLALKIREIRPRVHAFGHIHSGYGVEVNDGIIFVNASVCDETYAPVNPVHVIDL